MAKLSGSPPDNRRRETAATADHEAREQNGHLCVEGTDGQGAGEEAALRLPLLAAEGAAGHVQAQQRQGGSAEQLLETEEEEEAHVQQAGLKSNETLSVPPVSAIYWCWVLFV